MEIETVTIQSVIRGFLSRKTVDEYKRWKNLFTDIWKSYSIFGCRSSKKTDIVHNFICNELINLINKKNKGDIYSVKTEINILSLNSSGFKKCDIVVFKNKIPFIVIPVKIIMTNFKQNKNNYYECLTGEISHLKWANSNLNIVPINIYFNKIPYLDKNRNIIRYEKINNKDINSIINLLNAGLIVEYITIMYNVKYIDTVNNKFINIPLFLTFEIFKRLSQVFDKLIC